MIFQTRAGSSMLTCALLTALTLAGCGGGSDSSSSGTPPPPPAQATLTLTGTAASGAVIAGALVEAVCASGSGSVSSESTGSFTIVIPDGSLPCALRVPASDGTVLHSVISGAAGASTATVNISPLTELVVAQAIGTSPDTLFTEFASRQASVTAEAIAAGVAAVQSTLASVGIDLAGVNPLTDALVAGNAQDQQIDALHAKLDDAGTTLAGLSDTVALSSPLAPTAALNGTPSLPPNLLLQPQASNCAALRSGTYRAILFQASTPNDPAIDTFVLDAAALVLTNASGDVDTLTPIGTCRYVTAEQTEVVVSQAGVLTFRGSEDAGVFQQGIAFPEQSHPLAALAGVWNSLGFEGDFSGSTPVYTANSGTLTFGADGKLTALVDCADVTTCETSTAANLPSVTLGVNAAGGFDFVDTTDNYTDRLFVYRSGGGELMAVLISPGGSFSVLTRQRVGTLPEVGTITRLWNQDLTPQLTANPTSESANTIASVDAATSSFVRTRTTGSGATYGETLQANQPRDGYTTRAAATATASDGSTVNVRGFIALPLRGTGLSVLTFPASGIFEFSVVQPGGSGLPAGLLGRPFAANCTALRSGTLRFVFAARADTGYATTTRSLDATTLALTDSQGAVVDRLVADGPCKFISQDGVSQAVVSPAGVLAIRLQDEGELRLGVAFPEQAHDVAELAGSWTKLGFTSAGTSNFAADAATLTYDATGVSTATTYCADVVNCTVVTGDTLRYSINADGGFDRTDSVDGTVDRFFAYRGGSGSLMLVQLSAGGSFGLWTPQGPGALPAVGSRSRSFDISVGNTLTPASTVNDTGTITIVSVDAAAKTWQRSRKTSSGATYLETLALSQPREGYTFRAAATATATDGSAVTVREFTAMGLKGMGMSALSLSGIASFDISVAQP